MSPTEALFTAMSTSLGMDASQFQFCCCSWWAWCFFGSSFTLFGSVNLQGPYYHQFKKVSKAGYVFAGPVGYLESSSFLAYFYSFFTLFLFAGWSSLQAKTMAEVYLIYIAVPEYVTGLIMTVLTIYLLTRDPKIGQVSKLVPVMLLYFGACGIILLQHAGSILPMLKLILEKLSPTAAIAGFAGSTALAGFREGTLKVHLSLSLD